MNTNGKLFEAPKRLLPVTEHSLRIDPDWRLKSLDGQSCNLMQDLISKNPASILTISCSSFSDPMVDTFRTPFLESGLDRSCGLIDLRPIPSRLKYALWAPFVKRAAKKEVPTDMHISYFVYRGGRELREMLGVPNLYGGYLILLDKQGFVRWRASGSATAEELSNLFASIRKLVGH